MEPMSRFTGRLSFTIGYRSGDAPGGKLRFGELHGVTSGRAGETRAIIGIYANKFKPVYAAVTHSTRDFSALGMTVSRLFDILFNGPIFTGKMRR